MDKSQKEAFKKIIPKYLSKMEEKESLSNFEIRQIKREIKSKLPNPNVSIYKKDMAKFILINFIENGVINNREDLDTISKKYSFVINNLEKVELETIADSYLYDDSTDYEDTLQDNGNYSSRYYLKDNSDWFLEIGLEENPFPSYDGLCMISENDYETVVLKTDIYDKYLEILEQNTKYILNKSIIVYGDFGCGKTTFFDYLSYQLLLHNILPIRIILNANPSTHSLQRNFNESLFNELADYISKYSRDPRGSFENHNKYNILSLFKRIKNDREQKGFVIFLDGLHKSQDQKKTALNFLIELQNILEFYRRKNISLTIFIAGSLEWRDNISTSKKFSGSIFTLEKMSSLNVEQAYEMLKRRFNVFSSNENQTFIKFNEIEMLITSIERTLATDVNFRILIKYFLQNGFIFKNRIKIKPYIEEDVLRNIYKAIKENKFLYKNIKEIKKEFQDNIADLSNLLRVISTTYDMGYFFKKHPFYQKNSKWFGYLKKRNIIFRNERFMKEGKKPYSLNSVIYDTFKDIENKVKFRPSHYFELLFLDDIEPVNTEAEYLSILDTVKRFKENNPNLESEIEDLIRLTENEYFALINEIENTSNFHISKEKVEKMNKIIERLLSFLYELSNEKFPINSQDDLFKIFRYTWLDNQVLTQYLNWKEGWNSNVNEKKYNTQFLKIFIDAYESLIFKIGKHILYNKVLIIGSKYLNNEDKIVLNSARAFFSNNKYKKAVEAIHDLIEEKLREFIFNVLFIKYGKNWETNLPKITQNYIKKIKKKEIRKYGEILSNSGNSLYYLTRGAYSIIIDDEKLWGNCFSILFGEAYRTFLTETLENLANLGHLDKHNRENDDIGKISNLIEQTITRCKEIVEKINKSYKYIIKLNSLIIKKSEIIPRFHSHETIDKLIPLNFDNKSSKLILSYISNINKNQENFMEYFIDLSDKNYIIENLSLPYRKFLGSLIYLIKNEDLKIKDHYGSRIMLMKK